ncbi:hypothetical protein [Rubinisphaera italica]|uniref:hypothetical protein n=1 Tax=Rubinisphaera italica TaxID=2527969 RepID=UPI0011B52A22|nr:hypothetical protein [Rubinisphaera italica]
MLRGWALATTRTIGVAGSLGIQGESDGCDRKPDDQCTLPVRMQEVRLSDQSGKWFGHRNAILAGSMSEGV